MPQNTTTYIIQGPASELNGFEKAAMEILLIWYMSNSDRLIPYFQRFRVQWQTGRLIKGSAVNSCILTQSFVQTQRCFCRKYNLPVRSEVPSRNAILRWVRDFNEKSSVKFKFDGGTRTQENIGRVREAFERSPRRSVVRYSIALHISDRSLQTILHLDLKLHLYKIQTVQRLNPIDKVNPLDFCTQFLETMNNNAEILNYLTYQINM
ncbi:unnamed protein product [Brassicogethes aeneus]|uniref:DUF4817 domain-containing protein n=1 Tax=Brassicogethes aeneus TaxID=1431903 RepID=A0A9P0FC74_BRAAE|nr:unnamed protein product [Brassicogethes aeneus]